MQRGSGILLHVTSLPSPFGIGDLGAGAYRFVDFLAEAGQRYWQLLPLNPTDAINHHSPYSCCSALAGNFLLISPEKIGEVGSFKKDNFKNPSSFSDEKVNYRQVAAFKKKFFVEIYQPFRSRRKRGEDFEKFCREHHAWLNDFALFAALKKKFKFVAWNRWPEEFRDRLASALASAEQELSKEIEMVKMVQHFFYEQWFSLKDYCREKNISIIGDLPMYVNEDSADVWAHRDLFKLDERGRPQFVGGVPPDYFSATGQRWGNPVYDWPKNQKSGYAWWVERFRHNLKMFDYVRVDHFRGFAGYWEIPIEEKTAVHGRWVAGPGEDFFKVLLKHFPTIPILAEDLGVITPDVRELMKQFGLPGMRVLQFAFGDDMKKNPYLPHNYVEQCVVYTGTHDNNTTRGWFRHDATVTEKKNLVSYVGHPLSEQTVPRELMRLAMDSRADVAMIPMQDILGLDQKARMNVPGTLRGNWQWRLKKKDITKKMMQDLRERTKASRRI